MADFKYVGVEHPAFKTEFQDSTTKGLLTITLADVGTGEIYERKQLDDLLTLHTLNIIAGMYSEFFDSVHENTDAVCLIEDKLHKSRPTTLFFQECEDDYILSVQYDGNTYLYSDFIKYLLRE